MSSVPGNLGIKLAAVFFIIVGANGLLSREPGGNLNILVFVLALVAGILILWENRPIILCRVRVRDRCYQHPSRARRFLCLARSVSANLNQLADG